MANQKNVRGRDLTAPTQKMEFNGREYALRFDMNCFRIAEDIYEEQYGQDLNFAEIAMKLVKGKLGAVMAVYYAAMISGGADLRWDDFAAQFKLTDIPGVRDRLSEMLSDALPDPEPGDSSAPLSNGAEGPAAPSTGTGSGTAL